MNTISLVRQLNDTGCGIACVAMIANKDYELAEKHLKKIHRWTDRKNKLYTRIEHLQPLLKKYKINFSINKSSSWEDIDGCAIVGVNRKKGGHFHWVVVIKDMANDKFVIVDPHDENGGIYHGDVWGDTEDGYWHSKRPTQYISINKDITFIEI